MDDATESRLPDSGLDAVDSWVVHVDRLVRDGQMRAAALRAQRAIAEAQARGDRLDASRAARRAAGLAQRGSEGPSAVEILDRVEEPDDPAERLRLLLARAVAIDSSGPEEDVEIDRGGWSESVASADAVARYRQRHRSAWFAALQAASHPDLRDSGPGLFETVPRGHELPWLPGLPPRDRVAQRWASTLSNRYDWTPAEQLAFEDMTTESLLDGPPPIDLDDLEAVESAHPARLATTLLATLERAASKGGGEGDRRLAALARLARLRSVLSMEDRRSMREAVTTRRAAWLDRLERLDDREAPWGLYLVEASLGRSPGFDTALEEDVETGRLVRRALFLWADAAQGDPAFEPVIETLERRLAELERPVFRASVRSTAAPSEAVLEVTYRNVPDFQFAIHPLDLREPGDLGSRQLTDWFVDQRGSSDAVMRQTVALEPTPDFGLRTLRIPLPLDSVGRWALLFELPFTSRFGPGAPQREALVFQTSPWAVSIDRSSTGLDIVVQDGETGRPVVGADVEVLVGNRSGEVGVAPRTAARLEQKVAQSIEVYRATTDSEGSASVEIGAPKPGSFEGSVIVERADGAHALDFSFWSRNLGDTTIGDIVTDRSAYRPGHEVQFTVALREPGDGGRQVPLAERVTVVHLLDPSQEERAEVTSTTDDFGLIEGVFTLPATAPLGEWTLQVDESWRVARDIAVEEYRRPTSELHLDAPAAPRLGEPMSVRGRALDSSGRPLRSLEVAWTATETSMGGLHEAFSRRSSRWIDTRIIARGRAQTDGEGQFEVVFERPKTLAWWEAVESGQYTGGFWIEAEATTEGGETIEARVQFPVARPDRAVEIEVHVTDSVSDSPRATFDLTQVDPLGRPVREPGEFRLEALIAPPAAEWPPCADSPAVRTRFPSRDTRPCPAGDDASTRLAEWEIAAEVAAGAIAYDAAGHAKLTLPLEPGGYRFVVHGEDSSGVPYESSTRFLAIGEDSPPVPLVLQLERSAVAAASAENSTAEARGPVHAVVSTAFSDQPIDWRLYRSGELLEQRVLDGPWPRRLELPTLNGSAPLRLVARLVRDHHELTRTATLYVDPDPRRFDVEIGSFRDGLRPGEPASLRVAVSRDGEPLEAGEAAVTATVFDRALESIETYRGADLLTDDGDEPRPFQVSSLGVETSEDVRTVHLTKNMSGEPRQVLMVVGTTTTAMGQSVDSETGGEADGPDVDPVRRDFSETALWAPARSLGADGSVTFDFRLPDAATEWAAWAFAFGRDGGFGSASERARSARELLVRPRVPRFFREGDAVDLAVTVSWEGEGTFEGTLDFDLLDPESTGGASVEEISRLAEFGAPRAMLELHLEPGETATLQFPLRVPQADGDSSPLGAVAVRAVARGQALVASGSTPRADGELRLVPVLPARVRLTQSRARLLSAGETATLRFEELEALDPERQTESFSVLLEGRLIESAFAALPYLVDFPYRCAEQTASRLLAASLAGQLLERYPTLARTADAVDRQTRFEPFELPAAVPLVEECAWALENPEERIDRLHDPEVVATVRDAAIRELDSLFDGRGGVPWFAGGRPSARVTAQVLATLLRVRAMEQETAQETERALDQAEVEEGSEVEGAVSESDFDGMILNGLEYLRREWVMPAEAAELEAKPLSESDASTPSAVIAEIVEPRRWWDWANWTRLLEILSYTHETERLQWTASLPRVVGWALEADSVDRSALGRLRLAMALQRLDRPDDARRIWRSVADGLAVDPETGASFLRPNDRSTWDDGHVMRLATALQALLLIEPESTLREPLVRGLLASRTLSRWESTLATAEAVWALAAVAIEDGSLDATQVARVRVGAESDSDVERSPLAERSLELALEPGSAERGGRLVLDPESIGPWAAETEVVNEGPGLLDAVATWRFATATPPVAAAGDRLRVERRVFRRIAAPSAEGPGPGESWERLEDGDTVAIGDLLEVRLRVEALVDASFVHLRDPRPGGFEPEAVRSGWRWGDVAHYREIRDSGINLFFEQVPAGTHQFRHRLRAAVAGTFQTAPAQIESFYAPEHGGYSTALELRVE